MQRFCGVIAYDGKNVVNILRALMNPISLQRSGQQHTARSFAIIITATDITTGAAWLLDRSEEPA